MLIYMQWSIRFAEQQSLQQIAKKNLVSFETIEITFFSTFEGSNIYTTDCFLPFVSGKRKRNC